jgi:hypothetical protein
MGWAWMFAESIFLERNWEKDKETIGRQIKELVEHPDPIWVSVTLTECVLFRYRHITYTICTNAKSSSVKIQISLSLEFGLKGTYHLQHTSLS